MALVGADAVPRPPERLLPRLIDSGLMTHDLDSGGSDEGFRPRDDSRKRQLSLTGQTRRRSNVVRHATKFVW